MDTKRCVFVGVGGQGNLLASNLLGQAALASGIPAVVSEIHGMAQRGGPLESFTRLGNDVHGPIISPGSAEVIISLELIEGLRNIERLAKDGWLIVAETKLPSGAMWVAGMEYPDREEVLAAMKGVTERVVLWDVQKIARAVGNINAANVALLGIAMASVEGCPISQDSMRECIKVVLPPKLVDINLKAFEEGIRAASAQ